MKFFTAIFLIGALFIASCQTDSTDSDSIPDDVPQDYNISTVLFPQISFSCTFDEEETIEVANGRAKVTLRDGKADNIEIDAIKGDKFIRVFINLFDGKGEYLFENNADGIGIAMSEMKVQSNGTEKEFSSVKGKATILSFNLENRTISGTFEAEYFHQGTVAPEFVSITNGKFESVKKVAQ